MLAHHLGQRATRYELHAEEATAIDLADVVNLNDIRMAELSGRIRFPREAGHERGVAGPAFRHHFERDGPIERKLLREKDGTHAAATEFPHDPVPVDIRSRCRIVLVGILDFRCVFKIGDRVVPATRIGVGRFEARDVRTAARTGDGQLRLRGRAVGDRLFDLERANFNRGVVPRHVEGERPLALRAARAVPPRLRGLQIDPVFAIGARDGHGSDLEAEARGFRKVGHDLTVGRIMQAGKNDGASGIQARGENLRHRFHPNPNRLARPGEYNSCAAIDADV